MRHAVKWRGIAKTRDFLGMGLVTDVEYNRAAVDIADVGAVWIIGINVHIMRAVADIEARMAWNCWLRVGVAGSRIPPAARLNRRRWIAYIDDAVDLVILGMARRKVRRAGTHMHIL